MSAGKYIPTIGIETHVQLKTKTKLFAAVDNNARDAAPNTLISHICVGMPGALPYLNQAAIELAARAAFAFNTKPQAFSKFDRKHYFYPDLPKGYQISQYDQPIIVGGHIDILVAGQAKRIGITRAHLEEDAGKNIHPAGADYSLVDLNRAGTPLLEIVSEPDIHSAVEAKAYARELYLLMKYSGVSDVDLYHGNLRFDVNISVSPNASKLGTRSEIKNLNSFRSVENAVKFEINRQIELLERGGVVVQETRGWDEAKQKTTSQRGKEEAHDYRYMPEPDIPPVELSESDISRFKKTLPELPPAIRQKLTTIKVEAKVVEDILDKPDVVPTALEAISKTSAENARRVIFQLLEASNMSHVSVTDQIKVAEMVSDGELNSTAGKLVAQENLKTGEAPARIIEKLNLIQVSDEDEIEKIVAKVLEENKKAASDVKEGELKAIGFLVGQVMAKSHGKANPGVAQKIIKKQLGL
ncbi:Asp-tRNA(Asn)/Glu-tRNA(Gln) amidotransferase subunit GatB [Candidatus Saccharibacteria bacterium CG10_big_fil_rev_8_21_14_0_10_47_8]|nr:MAG: Asp-tRNA(Asn)/Glu-tRNA(Gln) amidotransferase subunit GatB [Candidatus Saccharibacteria bacterium CG10_big_fil_rev_8_21_14_0_10_47_8]